MTVWRVRVAQELFGEPKPAPEIFWPQEATMIARRSMDDPVSAAAPVLAASHVATIAPARATGSLCTSPPVLLACPGHSVRPTRAFFRSAIAALLVIGITGLTMCYAYRGQFSASPQFSESSGKPTIDAQTAWVGFLPEKAPYSAVPIGYAVGLDAAPPIMPLHSEETREAAARPSGATLSPDETPQMVAEAKPELPLDFTAAPIVPESKSVAAAASRKQSGNLGRKSRAAIKIVSSRAGQSKPSVHSARRNQANPLVVMRRAVKSFAAGLAKNLQRIPYQISSLIAGR